MMTLREHVRHGALWFRRSTISNAPSEWQPQDEPELFDVHDNPSDASGQAIPYGVYDVAANNALVGVGSVGRPRHTLVRGHLDREVVEVRGCRQSACA